MEGYVRVVWVTIWNLTVYAGWQICNKPPKVTSLGS